jgi:hypothetical protein
MFTSARGYTPTSMEAKPRNSGKVVVYLLAVLITLFGLLAYRYQRLATDQCGPAIREYKNSRYGYEIMLPPDWRLATKITLAVNSAIPVGDEESVYVTRLDCGDELRISRAVPKDNPFSGGELVKKELIAGNIFVLFSSVTDGGLDFTLEASKTRFRNTTVSPVENVRTETLKSGVSTVRYELRSVLAEQPYETVFVPYHKNLPNAFGHVVKGFIMQAVNGMFFSEKAFSSFYGSFRYLP